MYLLQHPEVKGDCNIGKFKDCFKISAIDYEGGRETRIPELGTNTRNITLPKYSAIRVTKTLCAASRSLEDNCNFGAPVECKIYLLDTTNTEYMEICLTNALLSNYQFKAHGGVPIESFDITFTAVAKRHLLKNEKNMPSTPASNTFNISKMAR